MSEIYYFYFKYLIGLLCFQVKIENPIFEVLKVVIATEVN